MRGTTRSAAGARGDKGISIHVPRAGYDASMSTAVMPTSAFLSTYPVRGTTTASAVPPAWQRNFYPRTPCGVRHRVALRVLPKTNISIHVPRAGYDCEAGRRDSGVAAFLSTYPVRGTTPEQHPGHHRQPISIHVPRAGYDLICCGWPSGVMINFYPRTPCGVRPGAVQHHAVHNAISIHVPRAGYDSKV